MANLTALRAAVSSLSAKNLGGADNRPPAVRELKAQDFDASVGGESPVRAPV